VQPWDGDAGEDVASGPFSPCNPDLRRYQQMPYREPDTPSYLVPQPEAQPGQYGLLSYFPPTANNGLSHVTYWLTGEEDLVFTVRVLRGGTVFGEAPESFMVTVFLDGDQVSFEHQGRVTRVLRGAYTRTQNRFEFPIRVPASAIADGGHVVNVLWVDEAAGRPDRPFNIGNTFQVFKNATDFRDPYPLANAEILPWIARRSQVYDPVTGRPLAGRIAPPTGGTLALRIESNSPDSDLRNCRGATQNYLYVALLDGEQIPLGELGMHPFVNFAPTQSAILRAVLQGLPNDGRPHQLLIYELPNYQRYIEGALDNYTAWGGAWPDLISLMRW
jgi:hypothetical protein